MGTLGVHKFHFTSDSAQASHVAWEHLDYEHTTDAFLLDCAFTHHGKHGKHPQVVELPTRPSHLVGGALVRRQRSYSPPQKLNQCGLLVWNKVLHIFLEEDILLLEHQVG